jgi:hypothetical protein
MHGFANAIFSILSLLVALGCNSVAAENLPPPTTNLVELRTIIGAGQQTELEAFGDCVIVTNNYSENVVIPMRVAAEWQSFRTNPPPRLTIKSCNLGLDPDMVLVFDTRLASGGVPHVSLSEQLYARPWQDLTIDWGDGSRPIRYSNTSVNANPRSWQMGRTYARHGIYTVRVTGQIDLFGKPWATSVTDPCGGFDIPWQSLPALVRVESFGNTVQRLNCAFYAAHEDPARRLPPAELQRYRVPELPRRLPAQITDLSRLFAGSLDPDANIAYWDVSRATTMQEMFRNSQIFQADISMWRPSSVTNFSQMFQNATAFNRPIGNWTVGSGQNFWAMFRGATSFNQPLAAWNTAAATEFGAMFENASSFNQPLTGWNTSRVWSFNSMFRGAASFNSDVSGFNVSSAFSMNYMFQNATSFNADITGWSTGRVAFFEGTFSGATSFNRDISRWNMGSAQTIRSMFAGARSFNQPIGSWVMPNLVDLGGVFANAEAFNQPLDAWGPHFRGTRMEYAFDGARSFNQPLPSWAAYTNMLQTFPWHMFRNASAFRQNLSNWCFSHPSIRYSPVTLENFASGSAMTAAQLPKTAAWDYGRCY